MNLCFHIKCLDLATFNITFSAINLSLGKENDLNFLFICPFYCFKNKIGIKIVEFVDYLTDTPETFYTAQGRLCYGCVM